MYIIYSTLLCSDCVMHNKYNTTHNNTTRKGRNFISGRASCEYISLSVCVCFLCICHFFESFSNFHPHSF